MLKHFLRDLPAAGQGLSDFCHSICSSLLCFKLLIVFVLSMYMMLQLLEDNQVVASCGVFSARGMIIFKAAFHPKMTAAYSSGHLSPSFNQERHAVMIQTASLVVTEGQGR